MNIRFCWRHEPFPFLPPPPPPLRAALPGSGNDGRHRARSCAGVSAGAPQNGARRPAIPEHERRWPVFLAQPPHPPPSSSQDPWAMPIRRRARRRTSPPAPAPRPPRTAAPGTRAATRSWPHCPRASRASSARREGSTTSTTRSGRRYVTRPGPPFNNTTGGGGGGSGGPPLEPMAGTFSRSIPTIDPPWSPPPPPPKDWAKIPGLWPIKTKTKGTRAKIFFGAFRWPPSAVGCPSSAVQLCAQILSWRLNSPRLYFI